MPPRGVTTPGRHLPAAHHPRRPGRPRRSDGPAVTRGAIVGAALATLQAEGAAGLSLRDVARRLDVTLPTLQRHFPTKDDLWRACVDEALRSALADADAADAAAAAGGGTDGEAPWLTSHVRSLVARSSHLPGLTAAILNDSSPGGDERLEYLVRRAAPVLARGRGRIEEAIAAGRGRPVDVDVALALVTVGLTSLATSRVGLRRLFGIDLDDPAGAERFAAGLVDLLRHGLAT
ncbi:MAG TPA: TetR/AcrR family transcriptional regulator [Acidimicrobiales bacterium]|nr:TetR/AcrR family transcriptional regulator [Acidimicrobiales bacterium]